MLRLRPGAAPGTLPLVEAGAAPGPAAQLTVTRYTDHSLFEVEVATLDEALASLEEPGVTWLNVGGIADATLLARLGERLRLHPLALEDAVNVPQRPKVEFYPDHGFVVLRMLRTTPELTEEQVSLFFGHSWVVTVQERAGADAFGPVRERIRGNRGRVRSTGADYLAYSLLDAVVDGYFPVLEAIGDHLNALEDEAIVGRGEMVLPQIQRLRRDLLTVRRAVWPAREAVLALQREESAMIGPETRVFLRDCYDHTVQALEVVETFHETAAAVLEIYVSVQNQRLNEVMKVLTVIATLFIPLTFIASIYGMNFKHMPELDWAIGYPVALGLMVAVAAGLITYFRRRGWW